MIDRRLFLGLATAATAFPSALFGQATKTEVSLMSFRMAFGGHSMTATLFDNPSARELKKMLPLDLTIEDYSTNEKIAYLPRKLTQVTDKPFDNARPGDIAYYAPWGNLVFYYDSYRYSKGLIRLGRFDDGFEPLLTRGEFSLCIERA
ncbi:cyclophilin-like fold protein [Agrobacterium tumefaciens]|uniref:cyclophilin-like fold protein n=1 Tax=Agrobacterium tumefaciens TaxID=358 RepID=UPI003BA1E6A3